MKTKLYQLYAVFSSDFICSSFSHLQAQSISIELGANEIGINEQFTITVKVEKRQAESLRWFS